MKKTNKKFLIIIICIICILCYILSHNTQKNNQQEDILFLKFLGKNKSKNTIDENNENSYYFNVEYKNINFRTIGLEKTIDKNTLVNEKIAPGTRGNFNINIYSSKKCKYKVIFKSKNQKPKNLIFYTNNQKFGTLEELQKTLDGYIEENIIKCITIFWQWEYENGKEQDIIDTDDGKLLSNYCFDIAVYSQMEGDVK